jgi:hypothetical protein
MSPGRIYIPVPHGGLSAESGVSRVSRLALFCDNLHTITASLGDTSAWSHKILYAVPYSVNTSRQGEVDPLEETTNQ